jgi:uncharacterized membrane protein YvbJ
MALIQCKECKGQVSDQAETCPHCGVAINKIVSANTNISDIVNSGPALTKVEIEQTNKKWKSMYLNSWIAFIFALICFYIGQEYKFDIYNLLAGLFFFAAIILRYTSKIGAWWNNK